MKRQTNKTKTLLTGLKTKYMAGKKKKMPSQKC
jgi:hypothetical protein